MPWFKKKPWEKELCSYVLQEYGVTGGKGWVNVTEATETPITRLQAAEFFNPGKTYRVFARYMEGDRVGQFAGVVWQHHVPAIGLELKREEEEKAKKKEKEEKVPADPADFMDAYADKLVAVIQPIAKLQAVLEQARSIFNQPATAAPVRQSNGEEDYAIPPPEYEGKLPMWTHPAVIKGLFRELNDFVDHTADRFGNLLGGEGGKPQKVKEEEEEPLLPSIRDFTSKRATKIEEPTEIQIEDEEVTLPMPQKKEKKPPKKELSPPEEKAETVPSLFSEEIEKEEKTEVPEAPTEKERKK